MQVLHVRNVHDALVRGMDLLYIEDNESDSRNGKVYEATTPVTTVYKEPKERVLFWEERDANPFFHFMEGLWTFILWKVCGCLMVVMTYKPCTTTTKA